MIALLFLGTTIYYLDRVNLSVVAPTLVKVFHTNLAVLGLILSAFTWSFTALQIPPGPIVDRLGVKRSYTLSALWWEVASLATAVATSIPLLLGARVFWASAKPLRS